MSIFNANIPISFSGVENPRMKQFFEYMFEERPLIVLRKKLELEELTYNPGALLQLDSTSNDYIFEIAEQINGVPILFQEKHTESDAPQFNEANTLRNIAEATQLITQKEHSYSMIDEFNNLNKQLNMLQEFIGKCVLVPEGQESFYIKGYIRNMPVKTDYESVLFAPKRKFGEGDGDYFVEALTCIDFGEKVSVKPIELSTEYRLRKNVSWLADEMRPIIYATIARAQNRGLHVQNLNEFNIDAILANEAGLKFSWPTKASELSVEGRINAFESVVTPITKGLQKAIEDAYFKREQDCKNIAKQYFFQ